MTKKERLITKRVNFYDGHRVTEKDLDTEQINNNALVSNLVTDFHGSGIIQGSPFEQAILLDTKNPGAYGENTSETDIKAGRYDGKAIYLDRQPSDVVYGNRLELELIGSDVMGRQRTKVMIIGRAFDGTNSQGELVLEFVEFFQNEKKVSAHYFTSIIAVIFNNFSGGTGKTELEPSAESLNLIQNGGYLVIKEAPQMSVYPASRTVFQVESPNYDLNNFVSSDPSRSILTEIELALGASNNIQDMYIELLGKEKLKFEKLGATSISYGQKFLSNVNNLQKIDLLLSVERDEDLPLDNQLDFSGNIVISIHQLISNTSCPTDVIPDDLIDFDPEVTPIVEISYNQDDLEALGYKLDEDPQVISFNFAGTLIADPNIDPSLEKGKYYAILVSRRGDNRTGTVIVEKGWDKVSKKAEDGTPQTTVERFGKQHSKYIEYDPITKRYVNDSTSSLWFQIHSDTVEVTDGTAYTDSGVAVTVPKFVGFVGNTQISNFQRDISLRTVSEGINNYLILSQMEEFSEPGVHPRTNNFVFTRISDAPSLSMVNSTELSDILEDTTPIILAKIQDKNTRTASEISGSFDKPGLVGINTIKIIDPGNDILLSNLIGRIITPDTGCSCNARYRIVKVDCQIEKVGDLNSDKKWTSADLKEMLKIVGNTINSRATEELIINGDLDVVDFIKSDLNNDGTIDGTDIELLENAVDGYVNFSVPEEFRVLTLHLENVLESSDFPVVFEDTSLSGVSIPLTNQIELLTGTENDALAIRVGDMISILSGDDAGDYIIISKEMDLTAPGVFLTVNNLSGESPEFVGGSNFNSIITSGSRVNLYADNKSLAGLPFKTSNYSIDFIESPFQENFIDICDLKRYVGSSFLELKQDSCLCEESTCAPEESCEPIYKNQTYLPGDLYLPEGNILSAPGVPHHGDFEYTNIKIPLPPGSISGCSIDLYTSFVKSKDGSCLTAAGFPAMKYSDGTLVGCEDVGPNNDIAKGRVKFSNAISGICVDTVIDGYGIEQNPVSTTVDAVEVIGENFVDYSFTAFDAWTEDGGNNTSIVPVLDHLAGPNEPAIFGLTTQSVSSYNFGRLNGPASLQDIDGDFIIDFKMSRDTWPETSLVNGVVYSFAKFEISNLDGTTATLKLGWKVIGGYTTKMFYSGVIEDLSSVLSSFNFEIDAPDSVTDIVLFRLRRINDVVSAYYIIPDKLELITEETFGQYVRIGSNPDMQPGSGETSMSVEISQENSPTTGLSFFTRLIDVVAREVYSSDDTLTTLSVGRDNSTSEIDSVTITVPFPLPRKTSIVSASLIFTVPNNISISDTVNIIPLALVNADNIGKIYNIPLDPNLSLVTSFSPGSVAAGSTFSVDVTTVYKALASNSGHLPGFLKGFVIEPDLTMNSSFQISSEITLEVSYVDTSTGMIYKIGVDLDPSTGIATFDTKNILFDALNRNNRTVLNFGVYLKKAGFKNQDIEIAIDDLARLGIGNCLDNSVIPTEEQCYFIAGSTSVGVFVEGPFPCP
jgi:hypothetical protein